MGRNTAVVLLNFIGGLESLSVISLSAYLAVNYSLWWLLLLLILCMISPSIAARTLKESE